MGEGWHALRCSGMLVTSATEGGWRLRIHPCLCVCLSVSRMSQKVMDRFGQNLVERMSVWHERTVWILLRMPIWILTREFSRDSSLLRFMATNDTQHDISKSYRRIRTKLVRHVGCVKSTQ